MAGGSLQLHEYPALDRAAIVPEMRAGRSVPKAELIARYGADIRLPDLRWEISQCRRHGQMHDACMVHYVELTGGK